MKSQLRKYIKQRREALSADDRKNKSRMIQEKLLNLDIFKRSQVVLAYASLGGEVDTWGILRESLKLGKIIGLPKSDPVQKALVPMRVDSLDEDLESGLHGILEPRYNSGRIIPFDRIDLVITPALAFDRKNFRLGRGAGFYDRFLSKISPSTVTVGLAFDCQIIDALPEKNPFDLPVSIVITN